METIEKPRAPYRIMMFLRDNTPVVKGMVPGESAAFTIFETHNDRGFDVSPLELIKRAIRV